MTLRAYLMSLFPISIMVINCILLIIFIRHVSWLNFGTCLFFLYLFPLLCFRLHHLCCPIQEGYTPFDQKKYSAWWGAHQLQMMYNLIPLLEIILRLIPRVYSIWLRAWGSSVGKNIYWTPRVEIVDRSLVCIGDHVILGDRVACYSHMIIRKNDQLILYVKPVVIADNVFLGGGVRLAPGATITQGLVIPALTDVYPNQTIAEQPH